MRQFILNARFMLRDSTGVDRFAREISGKMAEIFRVSEKSSHLIAVMPRLKLIHNGTIPDIKASDTLSIKKIGSGNKFIWEQIFLLLYKPCTTLLSLCNIGPIFRRNQCLMVADSQFITQPQSYSWVFRTWYKIALPIAARRSRYLVTISNFSKNELEFHGIFPRGKAIVVPCAPDHIHDVVSDEGIFNRSAIEVDKYFLMIGSLASHKNMVPVLTALHSKLPEGTNLVVAGGFDQRIFRSVNLSFGDSIIFTGRVSDEELVALYKGAVALLFPSITEGFGLPPLEAMAVGCPVVASTGGAIPEVCGTACLYADPYDMDQWIAVVSQIWTDTALRIELIDRGRAHAASYSWAASAQKLWNLIK